MVEKAAPIIVIGAGVVGINIALALQKRGQKVLVLDRKGVCAETSQGNAGAFALTDILPLATPSIIYQAPKWLLDPLGPLHIPPSYLLPILPWLYRFLRASRRDIFHQAVKAQAYLMQKSADATERLIKDVNGEHFIRREGQLQLYGHARNYRAYEMDRKAKRDYGIAFDELKSAEAIADIQPGLNRAFTHGIFTPRWMNVVDPKKWVDHLARIFVERGGAIEIAQVKRIEEDEDQPVIICADRRIAGRKVIICCGAWSHHLAKTLGDIVPLETERGYNTTLPKGAFDLKTSLTFSNDGFVVTKINEGVRVGGAVELGGLKLPPNYKRADHLLQKVKRFLPELDISGGKQWMGYRPSLPDSLPVLDRAPAHKHIFYAFGHGHLGLTQAAGTGQIMADMVMDIRSNDDLSRFAVTRF